ncbi:MAG: hypothetical protein M3O62_10695 [Pseudomonadota bacterium]|nr:hypothetical protein [Pseudomonadota bacterium]
MNRLAAFFGLVIAGIGLVGVAAPAALLEVSSFVLTPAGLYSAAAFRVVVGVVLVVAAAASRMPGTVRVLGVLILIGGIATPLIGVDRVRTLIDWWSALGPMFMRAWAGLAVVLGLFVVYAVSAARRAA